MKFLAKTELFIIIKGQNFCSWQVYWYVNQYKDFISVKWRKRELCDSLKMQATQK